MYAIVIYSSSKITHPTHQTKVFETLICFQFSIIKYISIFHFRKVPLHKSLNGTFRTQMPPERAIFVKGGVALLMNGRRSINKWEQRGPRPVRRETKVLR